MPLDPEVRFEVIAQTAASCLDPSIVISAVRAGFCGILDLAFADLDDERTASALRRFAKSCAGPLGVKLSGSAGAIAALPAAVVDRLGTVVLTPAAEPELCGFVENLRAHGPAQLRILLEVVSPDGADLAKRAKCDGIIAKGNESGGRVGESTSFILLQRLRGRTELPVWAQGGIGLHTVAAAYVAGAVGVVLDHQLLLTRESGVSDVLKKAVARMDGSETQCLGDEFGAPYRLFAGPASAAFNAINQIARQLGGEDESAGTAVEWCDSVRRAVTPLDPDNSVWLFGQDAAFAGDLARVFKTVPGILNALLQSVGKHVADAQAASPLAAGSALALSHGTEFPIVQGPMTRVSDRAEFALKVAEGGALPFLALALMRGRDIEALLEKTRAMLADRPWGVGILGFVPADLQAEQLAVVHAFRPDFALLAGGRPEQAFSLEQAGIPTYLHVPSPGLLRLFLEAGAKRFVFEGRECGGHVGPRTSFTLWNQMIDVLLANVDRAGASDIHILFAGGIHDAVSSAMVAAAAGPLARLGCKVGVLVGTAYTMTHEAIEGGAVVETFQEEVAKCGRTVLLETGPGHAIRCVDTDFVAAFAAEKRRLLRSGESHDHMRDTLEALNVGRLRIATKGTDRNPAYGKEPGAGAFLELDTDTQRASGLYMIGQVALVRDGITSIRELHQEISDAGTELLAEVRELDTRRGVAVLPPKPAEVAIIGMGCILPKAPDVETFWENILDQVDAIREVPADRWDWRLYFDPDKTAKDKIYSKWGGFIDDVTFDPLRYGIPPSSLKSIEPLQLLTLDVVRAALIDAGFPDGHIPDPELRRRTSVILGVGGGTGALGQRYAVRTSLPSLIDGTPPEVFDALPEWTEDSFPGVLLNVVAGRVANRFDLGGVNFTVDAACGSSLAAVRLAVQELEAGTSDMVIVGGCDAFQNPFDFVAFSKTQALSPRGKCRTFDATADGIAIGEGVALIVLRRVPDAMRDGARIYARIQGVGGSSDGRDKSLTAPRPEGQAMALRRAYGMANFSPATVGLIEAHGTGTIAGDRAEVSTLKSVFAESGADVQACAIGSVKSMIGHTKCASGTAGLIKAALALYHKVLPPTNNVETPNPEANFGESPFFVAGEARPWIASPAGHPRRAGVSAFGFGGTNFHVALEEHDDGAVDPARKVLRQRWPSELFLLGAPSQDDLRRQVERLAAEAEVAPPARRELRELAQERALAYRAAAQFRLGIVASSHEELTERIEAYRKAPDASSAADATEPVMRVLDPRGVYFSAVGAATPPRVAFLFPGQGAQYTNMMRDLAMNFDEAGEAFAAADAALAGKLPRRLSGFVFPTPAFSDEERAAQQAAVTQTNVAQPAIGAASVAMARLLESLGVRGEAAAGHSYGEYSALHYAGAFDEATLYALSEARGRTMVEVTGDDPGSMASVAADAATIERLLGAGSAVQVANRNAPDQTVIAGPRKAIEEASALLTAQGLSVKPVRVACGFHSRCVAPARDRFAEILREAPIRAPSLPVYSNMTASTYPSEAADVVALLADHLASPVNFQDEIVAMYDAGIRVFVEVGPGSILTGLVGRILKGRPHLAVASDMSARPGLTQLQHALAQLAVAGVPVALGRLFAERLGDVAEARAQRAKASAAPTAWLVNGGMARPAREPSKPARPVKLRPAAIAAPPVAPSVAPSVATPVAPPAAPQATAKPVVAGDPASVRNMIEKSPIQSLPPSTPSATSSRPAVSDRPVAPERPAEQPMVRPVIADRAPIAAAAPAGASQVMLQYQKLMEGFLSAQQNVMLAYLKGGSAQRPAVVADAVAPAPEVRRAVPPPAAQIEQPKRPASPEPSPVPSPVPPAARNGAAHTNGHATNGHAAATNGASYGNGSGHAHAAAAPAVAMPAAAILPAAIPPLAIPPATVPVAVPRAAATLDERGVADALIGMISERTGYPPEMLGLDLNIEADLGIDSIKRVEILGAFRKQYIGESTEHVRVAMEQITRRKTLREVVEGCHALLGELAVPGASNVAAASNGHAHTAAIPAAAPSVAVLDQQGVADALIGMISERTGYPPEMLGLDLNIEADLGIDSIKRVEILGAFRKQYIGESTEHVRVAMEQITRRKTLREVVEGCHALLGELAVPGASNVAAASNGHAHTAAIPAAAPSVAVLDQQGVADALIGMISERTGYPPEMLGLDLNIEADLGIDSIKRVEILGAFRKQYIGESTEHVRVAMEQITRRKTLREVVEGCHALLAELAVPGTPTGTPVGNGHGIPSSGNGNGAGNGHAHAVPAATASVVALDQQGVADALIGMISERTGYPAEMLGLDLNIEADLGIDSIKRVEILGAFRKQYIGESTEHVRVAMEQITRRKTLREVVEGCHALLAEQAAGSLANGTTAKESGANGTTAVVAAAPPAKPVSAASQFDDQKTPRFVIVPVRADVSSRPLRPAKGDVFLITDDEGGIATALAWRLRAAHAKAILLRMAAPTSPGTNAGTGATGSDSYSLDLSDMAAVKEFAGHVAAGGGRVAGLFHCLPLRDSAAFDAVDLGAWRGQIGTNVKSLFNLAAAFGETLDGHKAACAVAATRLGGSFGLDPADTARIRPALAGIPGLLKSFNQEWTNTRCKSVDFDAGASPDDIVETLLIEAARAREDVEVGYTGGSRHVFRTDRRPLSTKGRPVLDVGHGAVVLVTGGARGITAEIAREFAERHRPVLILCGSSALPPAAEDAATAGVTGARQLKAALIKRAKDSGAALEPAAIEAAYRRLLKEREIRENIAALQAAAASVEYHQVDVRDEAAFGGFIDRLYAAHGRVDGVIHGAGIVEDKLIRDKTGDSFDRVVDTKTASSFVLSRKLRPESLKFLALFTSVAGTFGNRGQSDYGAANEILSKLALHLDRKWPGRVVGISWGPWDKAGMVTPEIKRQFEAIGIEAVSIDLGRWAFDVEIQFGAKGEAEPIWGVGPWARTSAASEGTGRKERNHKEAFGETAQIVR